MIRFFVFCTKTDKVAKGLETLACSDKKARIGYNISYSESLLLNFYYLPQKGERGFVPFNRFNPPLYLPPIFGGRRETQSDQFCMRLLIQNTMRSRLC